MLMCALPDTTAPVDCAEACADLYACGLLTCAGQQNCPGFMGDPMESASVIGACEQGCAQQPALVSIIDPAACDSTIQTVSSLSPQFDDVCTNGIGGTTSTTTGATASSSTGGGMCDLPGTPPPVDCDEACSQLYDCGALVCNGGLLCPGFTGDPTQKSDFMAICLPECANQPVLIQVVDPTSCAGTVGTVENASPLFAGICANGP